MVVIIADHSIKEMAELIGKSDPPVPAGGTTLAVNGLLGVSLLQLSFKVSKKKWDENIKSHFSNYSKKFEEAEKLFANTITDDVTAFKTNQKQGFKQKEELKKIIEIPLKAANEAKEILKRANRLQKYIKPTVKADYKVAKLNLTTCIRAAIEIITSNYQFFDSKSKFIIQTKHKVKELEKIISNNN